jgi:adenosylmethionine-8-amino-7-oxononanoate aminotransferase
VRDRIANLAAGQQQRLKRLNRGKNVRRLGTITACEIGEQGSNYLSERAPKLLAFFRSRDLLVRPLGNTIYVMPPYCINGEDLDRIYDAIDEALAQF